MAPPAPPKEPTQGDAWASLNESDDWHGLGEGDGSRARGGKATGKKSPALQLLVTSGPELGRAYPLSRSSTLVGRGKTNDLVLSDGSISREHARLELRGDAVFVVDQKSGNGTFIDGERITQATLRVGQQVAFGHVKLQLEVAGRGTGATGTTPAARTRTSARAAAPAAAAPASAPAAARSPVPAAGARAPAEAAPARKAAPARAPSRLRAVRFGPLPPLGRRGRWAVAGLLTFGWAVLFFRHHVARTRAFAAVQSGAVAFAEHRWDEAEQAFVTAENLVRHYPLAGRWQRALATARHDEEVLSEAKDALEKGDLLRAHALLVPLSQSPLSERVFALFKQWREAQHGRILAAEAALQAHLPHEAQAMLEQIEAARVPRPDRTSLLTWQRRLSELSALGTKAAAWTARPRKMVSLWEQAASQSPAMRNALRAFKRATAADAPAAARKALGTPENNDERQLLADLNQFEQLWDTGIEEHRGKRAFAAIQVFAQAKNLSARLVGQAAALRRDLDAKLSDMYYVVGVQSLAAGKLPQAAEALHAALTLTPKHALSLRRKQELDGRLERMVDEAEFVRVSRPARCRELVRQVVATQGAPAAVVAKAKKLAASLR